ncbi:MAG: ATP-binding protein [Muribaculaceae bacterium]|nr:ATP-binding protein [Muribaculaceae bacterium]
MEFNYIPRLISSEILEALKYFPVLTLTGPRQSGKSTLLKHLFPDTPYFSMENYDLRRFATDDPRGFLNQFKDGVIIDEVQNVPELLSYIQGIVDEYPERRFYLTGSSQFALLKNVTQSLAGRTAVFELLPLSLGEVEEVAQYTKVDELLYNGFYPSVWSGRQLPKYLYPNYVKTYVERDVRDLLMIKDLDKFQRFIRLCAYRIGSVFNASEISNELGVAVNTVNSWLSVLQASYLVFLLPPFYTNTRKRLTKSPKIYFTDCGLASYLLDIGSPSDVIRDKMRGHLFENLIVIEYLKRAYNKGQNGNLYFYRDSNGQEVDLLVKEGQRYTCIEIKSSSTFHPDFLKGIKSFTSEFDDMIENKRLIYTGDNLPAFEGVEIVNYLDDKLR